MDGYHSLANHTQNENLQDNSQAIYITCAYLTVEVIQTQPLQLSKCGYLAKAA